METGTVRHDLVLALRKTARGDRTCQALADWTSTWWGVLMEGEGADDTGPEAALLRDVLGEIVGQWEITLGNAYEAGGVEATRGARFPGSLLTEWADRLRH